MSDLRTDLERLGERAAPRTDAFERLERRRRRKERNRRIGAGALALVLVVGGSLAAFTAFRDGGGDRTIGGGAGGFFALWPEQTEAALAQAQERVDSGDPELAWRSDPVEIARRFALEELLWPSADVAGAEGSNLDTDDVIFLELTVPPDTSCDQIVTGAACPTSPTTLVMKRLGAPDGLWSVTEVHGSDLTLPLVPGETVAAGTTLSVSTDLADGEKVSMGVAFLTECDAPGADVNVEVSGGVLEFVVPDVPDGCTGYMYAMRPKTEVGAVAIGSFLLTDAPATPAIGYLVQELSAVPVRFVNDAPADVAEFTCDEGELTPTRSVVAAQPDGVHVAVTNNTDVIAAISVGDLGGDGVAPHERGETVWQLPPGSATVSCSVESSDFGGVASSASITVVDPSGLYVPAELECANGQQYGQGTAYEEGSTGIAGDPVQVARDHVSGLEFDDLVETGGYPQAERPLVRIVRDGAVVATVTFFDDGSGGWLVDTIEGCGGTQFGWSDEPAGVTGPPADPGVVCIELLGPEVGEVPVSADLHVTGENIEFDPDCLAAPAGEPLTITFSNLDAGIQRNISIYPRLDVCLLPGSASLGCDPGRPIFRGEFVTGPSEIVYEFGPLEPGTYYFRDDVHPNSNGALIVI